MESVYQMYPTKQSELLNMYNGKPIVIRQMPQNMVSEQQSQYSLSRQLEGTSPDSMEALYRQVQHQQNLRAAVDNQQNSQLRVLQQAQLSDVYQGMMPPPLHQQSAGYRAMPTQILSNGQVVYKREPIAFQQQPRPQQQIMLNQGSQQLQQLQLQQQKLQTMVMGKANHQQPLQQLDNVMLNQAAQEQQSLARHQALQKQQQVLQQNHRLLRQLAQQQEQQDQMHHQHMQAAQMQQEQMQQLQQQHMQAAQLQQQLRLEGAQKQVEHALALKQLQAAMAIRAAGRADSTSPELMQMQAAARAQSVSPSFQYSGVPMMQQTHQMRSTQVMLPQQRSVMLNQGNTHTAGQPGQYYQPGYGPVSVNSMARGELTFQQAALLARDNSTPVQVPSNTDELSLLRKQHVLFLAKFAVEQARCGGSAEQVLNLAKIKGCTNAEIGFIVDSYIGEKRKMNASMPQRIPTAPSPTPSLHSGPPVLSMHSPESATSRSVRSTSSRRSSEASGHQSQHFNMARNLTNYTGEIPRGSDFDTTDSIQEMPVEHIVLEKSNSAGAAEGNGMNNIMGDACQYALSANEEAPNSEDAFAIPAADVEWLKSAAMANKALWDGANLADDSEPTDDLANCLANLDLGSGFF